MLRLMATDVTDSLHNNNRKQILMDQTGGAVPTG